jgi:hypothetical protein
VSLDLVFSAGSHAEVERAIADVAHLLDVTERTVRERVHERVRRTEWRSSHAVSEADIERIREADDFSAAYDSLGGRQAGDGYLAFERRVRRAGRRLGRLQLRENQQRATARRSA